MKESLFDKKVGKVTFSARKSLPCRYSALSLHSETGWKWPLSDLFTSSCLRHAFVVPSLLEAEEGGGQGQGIERLGGFLTRERNGGYEGYRDYWGGRLPPPSFFLAEGPVET